MPAEDAAVALVAERILRYFDEHPNAADTAEGIRKWWLPPGAEAPVQAALDALVARGLVELVSAAGGDGIYRRCHSAQ